MDNKKFYVIGSEYTRRFFYTDEKSRYQQFDTPGGAALIRKILTENDVEGYVEWQYDTSCARAPKRAPKSGFYQSAVIGVDRPVLYCSVEQKKFLYACCFSYS